MGNFRTAAPHGVDRERIADQIFRDLRNDIILGAIPNGTKLPSERELALRYGVSGPTVREAIRGLSLLGFADVRHGSGAYVVADPDALVATSLSAVIQFGKLGVADVLGVWGALSEHVAALAAQVATRQDHEHLRATLAALDEVESAEAAAKAVLAFHNAMAAAAHNPLLAALCGFLAELQTELGQELCDTVEQWRKIFAKLKPTRTELVAAVIARDRQKAVALAQHFHTKAVALITALPKAKEIRLNDPKLRDLLSSMMRRVG
jgi:GntR family transcriptional regulator, transcriptional repressor for pyruvate dehydrogenase complex